MTLRDKVLAATIRTIDSEWNDLCATLAKHHASRIGVNAVKSLADEVPALKKINKFNLCPHPRPTFRPFDPRGCS